MSRNHNHRNCNDMENTFGHGGHKSVWETKLKGKYY